MDNPQYRLELAKESMDISLTLLAIRLGLKKVSIEERYKLKLRVERLHRLTGELK